MPTRSKHANQRCRMRVYQLNACDISATAAESIKYKRLKFIGFRPQIVAERIRHFPVVATEQTAHKRWISEQIPVSALVELPTRSDLKEIYGLITPRVFPVNPLLLRLKSPPANPSPRAPHCRSLRGFSPLFQAPCPWSALPKATA